MTLMMIMLLIILMKVDGDGNDDDGDDGDGDDGDGDDGDGDNDCDYDCYLVMKVILVKEVMSCDTSPVAMFNFHFLTDPSAYLLDCNGDKIYTSHNTCELLFFFAKNCTTPCSVLCYYHCDALCLFLFSFF